MIDKILKQTDNIAYICDDEKITYKELYEKVNLYGELLQKEGNTPVIIYGPKKINYLIMMLSCIKAKRCYIPLNDTIPLNRIEEIISLSKTKTILTEENLNIKDINIITLEELEKYKDNKVQTNNNEICYMIFTSGSTGKPKGVPISYNNLLNFIEWITNLIPINEIDKVYNTALFSFDLSVTDIYYSIANNKTLVSSVDNDIYDSLKDINLLVATPSHLKLYLINPNFNKDNYPKLKYIYSCGERLNVELAKEIYNRFDNIKLINAYGPTEATSAVSGIIITKDMLKEEYLPVGNMFNNATKIEIINDEIILSGKSVFKGYLGQKEQIKEYHTKDKGYILNNKLYCIGRLDNQIKYMGYRIELGDIENNLLKIKGIKEAIVLPIYYKDSIKMLKAFLVSDNQDIDYIKKELNKYIPKYMIPKQYIFIEKMPLTNNYKIDRGKLLDD